MANMPKSRETVVPAFGISTPVISLSAVCLETIRPNAMAPLSNVE